MTEGLVKIATFEEILKYTNPSIDFNGLKNALIEEGIPDVESMEHCLIHYFFEPANFLETIRPKGYISNIIQQGSSTGSAHPKKDSKALGELKEMAVMYVRQPYLKAPHFSVTSQDRSEIVSEVLTDLGCRVEQLQPPK